MQGTYHVGQGGEDHIMCATPDLSHDYIGGSQTSRAKTTARVAKHAYTF